MERIILSGNKSRWLVTLASAFQDSRYFYLVMEYVPGGDMRGLLSNLETFPEPDARFYIAEMILAVLDLHREGYIHRDLKPENFLITKTGHLKLGDFGLSKKLIHKVIQTSFSFFSTMPLRGDNTQPMAFVVQFKI